MTNKLCTIYKFTNKITGMSYIGFTTKGLQSRKSDHKSDAKRASSKFHKAIEKYGMEMFEEEILFENYDHFFTLKYMEPYYIQKYDTIQNGYNMTGGGEGKSMEFSEASRRKISLKNSGSGNGMYGKKHTPESIEKITKASTGKNNPFHGKTHTTETKLKISMKKTGISTGPKSSETKQRMSEARKKYLETRKPDA